MTTPQPNYKKSEKWLEKELTKRVRALGGKALKFSSNIETGYPDRIVVMPRGKTYWCEIKSTGESPNKVQQFRHKELRVLGHFVIVIDSEFILDEFISLIKLHQG